jgi:hypothetical protein
VKCIPQNWQADVYALRRWVAVCLLAISLPVLAQDSQSSTGSQTTLSAEEVARKAQNPFADKISLSLNSSLSFNSEPLTGTAYEFDVLSLLPTRLGDGWRILHRPMLPVLHEAGTAAGEGGTFGLGDFTYQAFVTPNKNSKIVWGIGPALVIPTATNSRLGNGKWSAGPALGLSSQPGNWSLAAVAANTWSFAGDSARDSINQFSLELFFDYNLKAGWYVGYEPQLSADWKASPGERWLVPVGGGVGKAVALGRQDAVFSAFCYRNIARPTGAPVWQFQFGVQFQFTKQR